jgi:hypothetical protein
MIPRRAHFADSWPRWVRRRSTLTCRGRSVTGAVNHRREMHRLELGNGHRLSRRVRPRKDGPPWHSRFGMTIQRCCLRSPLLKRIVRLMLNRDRSSTSRASWTVFRSDRHGSGGPAMAARRTILLLAGLTLAEGWVQLFNGVDLSGWKTHASQRGKAKSSASSFAWR